MIRLCQEIAGLEEESEKTAHAETEKKPKGHVRPAVRRFLLSRAVEGTGPGRSSK